MNDQQLAEEIHKTDQVVLKFIEDSKTLLNHLDLSNDSKFSMIKTNLKEFLIEACLIEEDEL